MFKNFDDDPQYSDAHDDEEYFSTSSAEELVIDIVHQVWMKRIYVRTEKNKWIEIWVV